MIDCQGHVILAKVMEMFVKNSSCSFSYMHYFYPAPHRYGETSFLIALKTVLIIPAHRRSISLRYGHMQGHRMCQFGIFSTLTSVHVMNIYSFG